MRSPRPSIRSCSSSWASRSRTNIRSTIGWTNGKTRYWIAEAEGRKAYKIGDVGLHHYAFQLRNRKDVDALQAFLEKEKVQIVDPADEYYEDYYAVFFLDPDGLKLEGMKYGELTARKKKDPQIEGLI